MRKKKVKAIDLYSGIGGLSLGLKQAGIKIDAGIDIDYSCKNAFETNVKGDFIVSDIKKIKGEFLVDKYWHDSSKLYVLAGCAPCQPFSNHSHKKKDKEKTEKWGLLNQFSRLIAEMSPEVVTMENVPNLSKQKIFQDFLDTLKSNNYHVSYSNVYCPDYGIPQKRTRLVLLASKFGKVELLPPTNNKKNYLTTKDAIGHLPSIESGEICKTDPLHRASKLGETNLKRIKASKPNGSWRDWEESLRLPCHVRESGSTYTSVYGRMSWDEPSPTITTQFYNYGTGRFGHPEQDRALSIREAALLQTFPKNFIFYKDSDRLFLTTLSRQIGNAVPVRLGYIIGKSIIKHLNDNGKI